MGQKLAAELPQHSTAAAVLPHCCGTAANAAANAAAWSAMAHMARDITDMGHITHMGDTAHESRHDLRACPKKRMTSAYSAHDLRVCQII